MRIVLLYTLLVVDLLHRGIWSLRRKFEDFRRDLYSLFIICWADINVRIC